MRLLLVENADELLEISDTFASEKLEQLVVAVTWLYNVDKVVFLRRGNAFDITKFIEKCTVRVDEIQQIKKTVCQLTPQNFVQRSIVTEISSDICTSINLTDLCLLQCTKMSLDTGLQLNYYE